MPTNFQQNGNDIEQYLITVANKDIVPSDKQKVGTLWGSWGTLWSWGNNAYGAPGNGQGTPGTYTASPVQIGTLTNWKQVDGGYRTAHAIKNDGTLWTWGDNGRGQLGLGDFSHRSSPVQIGALTNWKLVSAGLYASAAIKTDGTLWSWGYNPHGQLGQGDTTNRSSPVQIGTLTNWKEVSSGGYSMFAIKNDGTLWSWGNNGSGQLGLGDITHRSSPVQIGSLTNWSKLFLTSASHNMMLAIKTDGTLWAWGINGYGQLGLNDRTHRSSPVQVGSLTNWSSGSAGGAVVSAIKTDGTLWAWGTDTSGYLGQNSPYSGTQSSPIQVGALTDWSKISMSDQKGYFGVKTDGTLWTFGYNTAYQLGLGNVTNQSSPVQIGTSTYWSSVGSGIDTNYAIQLI